MLSASQEIYSRRFRPVFLNRGKLFEGQYGGVAIRLLVNIDRCSLIAHGWGGGHTSGSARDGLIQFPKRKAGSRLRKISQTGDSAPLEMTGVNLVGDRSPHPALRSRDFTSDSSPLPSKAFPRRLSHAALFNDGSALTSPRIISHAAIFSAPSGGIPIASDTAHWGQKQTRCAPDFCRGFTPTVIANIYTETDLSPASICRRHRKQEICKSSLPFQRTCDDPHTLSEAIRAPQVRRKIPPGDGVGQVLSRGGPEQSRRVPPGAARRLSRRLGPLQRAVPRHGWKFLRGGRGAQRRNSLQNHSAWEVDHDLQFLRPCGLHRRRRFLDADSH